MLLDLLPPVAHEECSSLADPLMTLSKAIESLAPEQRVILSLIHFEELATDQIAVVLGVSQSSVDKIHQRAVDTLRARLALVGPEDRR